MEILSETRDGVVILRLRGKLLGGPDADALQSAVSRELSSGNKRLVMNLADIDWANSSGLGALMKCHKIAVAGGAHLRLAGLSSRIERIFDVTKLSTVFDTHTDEDAAIAAFDA